MDGLCGDIHIVRSEVHIVLQADLSKAFHPFRERQLENGSS